MEYSSFIAALLICKYELYEVHERDCLKSNKVVGLHDSPISIADAKAVMIIICSLARSAGSAER